MVAYSGVFPLDIINWCNRHSDTYPEIDPATKSTKHAGKAVFVTGASRGIGLATAISFAAAGVSQLGLDARGDLTKARDAIAARMTELGKPSPIILTMELDITSEGSVNAAARKVEEEWGRLDLLVNNAARIDSFTPVLDSSTETWWGQWEVNVRGVFLLTRAFIPLLLKGADMTIVNTSSIGAHMVHHGASSYQTGKLALLRFSEFVMHEYGDKGLLVYSIHPGSVLTDIKDNMTDEFNSYLADSPELSADSLVYLTQEKRDWLAGRYVDLTWDMPEFLSREKEIVEGDKLKVRLVL
jgi:NAD(P)-dependent dehydrogenase (short-subunit alcohol dehydrogenase family)